MPLILRGPIVSEPGLVKPTVVEMLDLAPTLLEACGVPAPAELQGRSLLPFLRCEESGRLEVALTEHDDWTSLRSRTHHYLVHADGREHLWDLRTDPHEQRDLARDPPRTATLPGTARS